MAKTPKLKKVATDSTRVVKKPTKLEKPDKSALVVLAAKQAVEGNKQYKANQKKALQAKKTAVYKMVDERIAENKKNRKK